MPDSISLLLIAVAVTAAWYGIGASRDAARQRRRADRLAARNARLAEQVDDLNEELTAYLDAFGAKWSNHPSQAAPRLRAVDES